MADQALTYILSQLSDIVFPPQPLFRNKTQAAGQDDNWEAVTFLDEPCCAQCGYPFEYDVGAGSRCGDCLASPPAFDRARAAFVYDEISRTPILAFKHGGRTEGLRAFTAHMKRAGRSFWADADIIVPVPLHPTRLIKRRFNQSALLAKRLAVVTGVGWDANILFRTRPTASQGHQTPAGRRRNVRGAFAVPEGVKDRIKGKHVVLVDDVMTTGATLNACARALKRGGASYIDVVTLARTVRQNTHSLGTHNAKD